MNRVQGHVFVGGRKIHRRVGLPPRPAYGPPPVFGAVAIPWLKRTTSTCNHPPDTGCYALCSGLVVIVAAGVLFTPIFHRIIHKFHAEAAAHEDGNYPSNDAPPPATN